MPNPPNKTTIKEVAALAGVSIATVSRVINNSGSVSPKLRFKVDAAIERLNYSPNNVARSLKTNKSQTVGVVIVNLYLPFFASAVYYLENNLRQLGYGMLITSHHDDAQLERQCLDEMLQARVDAIIVAPTNANDAILEKIQQQGTPVLLLDRISANQKLFSVSTDKVNGFYKLANELYRAGHRNLGIITGTHDIISNQNRYDGLLSFARDVGLSRSRIISRAGANVGTEDFGYETGKELLSLPKASRPTGVLLGNITLTYGFLHSCYEAGLRVPEDISVTTLGNFYSPHIIPLKLTYMDDQAEDISEIGVKMLYDMLEGKSEDTSCNKIPARIIQGKSIAPARLSE